MITLAEFTTKMTYNDVKSRLENGSNEELTTLADSLRDGVQTRHRRAGLAFKLAVGLTFLAIPLASIPVKAAGYKEVADYMVNDFGANVFMTFAGMSLGAAANEILGKGGLNLRMYSAANDILKERKQGRVNAYAAGI